MASKHSKSVAAALRNVNAVHKAFPVGHRDRDPELVVAAAYVLAAASRAPMAPTLYPKQITWAEGVVARGTNVAVQP